MTSQEILQLDQQSKKDLMTIANSKEQWKRVDVCNLIQKVKSKNGFEVNKLKIGDVLFPGALLHPVLVLSLKNNCIFGVLITSSYKKDIVLCETESRMFPNNYISNSGVFVNNAEKHTIMGVYDNYRHLQYIKKELKNLYKKQFNL